QWLGVEIVQIKDHQSWTLVFRDSLARALENKLGRLDELDFDAKLSRCLLDLGKEEEVVDEAEDARRLVFAGLDGGGILRRMGHKSARPLSLPQAHTSFAIGDVAILAHPIAIAVVHGPNESRRPAIAILAMTMLPWPG